MGCEIGCVCPKITIVSVCFCVWQIKSESSDIQIGHKIAAMNEDIPSCCGYVLPDESM